MMLPPPRLPRPQKALFESGFEHNHLHLNTRAESNHFDSSLAVQRLVSLTWFCAAILFTLGLFSLPAVAEDSEEQKQLPWISSVVWKNENEVVGTKSQGLPFRPSELVRAAASAPDELETMVSSETSLWDVIAVPEGQWLMSDYKGGLHLVSGDASAPVESDCRWVRALAQSPDADKALAGTEDGKLVVISISDKKEVARVDAHAAAIFSIALNASQNTIATAGGDGLIKLFSWPDLKPMGQMTNSTDAIWTLRFVDEDRRIVSGGAGRRLQLWDVDSQQSICTLTTTPDWITDLVQLPNSSVIVASCMNGQLVIADYQSMTKVSTSDVAASALWSIALSPAGDRLAVGTRKDGLKIVPIQNWTEQAQVLAKEMAQQRPPSPKASPSN